MKISLRWVCDHLNIDWKKIDVTALVERFNTSIAEIETVQAYSVDLTNYALGIVQQTIQTLVEYLSLNGKRL